MFSFLIRQVLPLIISMIWETCRKNTHQVIYFNSWERQWGDTGEVIEGEDGMGREKAKGGKKTTGHNLSMKKIIPTDPPTSFPSFYSVEDAGETIRNEYITTIMVMSKCAPLLWLLGPMGKRLKALPYQLWSEFELYIQRWKKLVKKWPSEMRIFYPKSFIQNY